MGFWHQRSEYADVEGTAVMLEEAIAEERAKIAELDRELQKRGISETEDSRTDLESGVVADHLHDGSR